jgi:hypothetical protein
MLIFVTGVYSTLMKMYWPVEQSIPAQTHRKQAVNLISGKNPQIRTYRGQCRIIWPYAVRVYKRAPIREAEMSALNSPIRFIERARHMQTATALALAHCHI